jgi:hypothetical protein
MLALKIYLPCLLLSIYQIIYICSWVPVSFFTTFIYTVSWRLFWTKADFKNFQFSGHLLNSSFLKDSFKGRWQKNLAGTLQQRYDIWFWKNKEKATNLLKSLKKRLPFFKLFFGGNLNKWDIYLGFIKDNLRQSVLYFRAFKNWRSTKGPNSSWREKNILIWKTWVTFSKRMILLAVHVLKSVYLQYNKVTYAYNRFMEYYKVSVCILQLC